MAKSEMPYMESYSNGYKPPSGSAGSAAFGEYSHKKNPLKVPKKGSSISDGTGMGANADRSKVARMEAEQARKENLRGYGC